MERNQSSHAVKRLLMSSALVAGLAFSGLSHAEGNKAAGDGEKQTEAAKVKHTSGISGLSQDQIKDLQRELAARGLYQGSIDGIAGQKTEAALRNFQTQQGLTVGYIDAKTRDALGLEWNQAPDQRQPMTGKEAESARKQPGRGPDTPERRNTAGSDASPSSTVQPSATGGTELSSLGTERVKQMQQRLQREGYYQGELDGVAGAQTRAALKRYFQRQAQLVEQGMMSDSAIGWFDTK
jgi:peptidoglycan hydrolase-like protein with peptidoglycan-binding domain